VTEGASGGKRILLVDDEPDVRTSVAMILRMEGYEVITGTHGADALDIIGSSPPDIVISDFMMPWMNGRELIVQLKACEATRGIPTIIVSGVTPGEPEPWDAFLRKPMDIAELLSTIERLLAGSRRGATSQSGEETSG
jgi:DNA-binding response OmpR family regulator